MFRWFPVGLMVLQILTTMHTLQDPTPFCHSLFPNSLPLLYHPALLCLFQIPRIMKLSLNIPASTLSPQILPSPTTLSCLLIPTHPYLLLRTFYLSHIEDKNIKLPVKVEFLINKMIFLAYLYSMQYLGHTYTKKNFLYI